MWYSGYDRKTRTYVIVLFGCKPFGDGHSRKILSVFTVFPSALRFLTHSILKGPKRKKEGLCVSNDNSFAISKTIQEYIAYYFCQGYNFLFAYVRMFVSWMVCKQNCTKQLNLGWTPLTSGADPDKIQDFFLFSLLFNILSHFFVISVNFSRDKYCICYNI